GDAFTIQAELQPGVWTVLGQFTQPMTVASIGPYVSNISDGATPAPAHTALVDYFFNTASPIVPEDGGQVSLTVNINGGGSVSVDPNQATYLVNDVVTLTAVADPGWTFAGWTGDVADANNPITITLAGDTTVAANFSQLSDVTPPVISNVVVTPSATSAIITWTTDEPASSDYRYGLTGAYELGGVDDPTLTTQHSIAITGLSPQTPYFYVIGSTDAAGNNATFEDSFTTLAPEPSTIVSDDFHGLTLDPNVWSVVNPLGDAVFSMSGTRLRIDVPGGVEHGVWVDGALAPRVMQAANDVDFEVEAKFDSLPQADYQVQGILIEQDASRFLRVSTHSDGGAMWLFIASFDSGTPQIHYSASIPLGAPQYLRVTRSGSQWRVAYSADGAVWTNAANFTHVMAVTAVGPFIGNEAGAQGTPAFSGVIDYFFNTAAPIVPEDGDEWSLTVNVIGGGDVARDPNGPTHPDGSVVRLTATPQAGWRFARWSGDVSSTVNPLDLSMTDETEITAVFESDTDLTPPVISGIQVAATHDAAQISWTTDEPATTELRYGLTSAFEIGAISDPNLVTQHAVSLSGLAANTQYFFEIRAIDAAGNEAVSATQSFTTDAPPQPSTLRSDNFSSLTLDPNIWTFENPLGDASLTLTGTHARIDVPGGVDHDLWIDGLMAPRLVQACNDADFAIEAKFDSTPAAQYQLQGLLIEQDPNTFVRFDVHHDGVNSRVFVATISQSVPTVRVLQPLPGGVPPVLRVIRAGDEWTMRYSYDGANWTTAAQFDYALPVAAVGVVVGNSSNGGPAPAFTGSIDYFQNLDDPVGPDPSYTLDVQTIGNGTVIRSPDAPTYVSGSIVELQAVPDPGWTFAGWSGDVVGADNPLSVTMTQDTVLTATFVRKLRRTFPTAEAGAQSIGP
ncbi:MAG: hypothetical protein D6744_16830, partial [Planctomycetota bacterium]